MFSNLQLNSLQIQKTQETAWISENFNYYMLIIRDMRLYPQKCLMP